MELLPHEFHTLPGGARLRYVNLKPPGQARGDSLVLLGRREFIEKSVTELGHQLVTEWGLHSTLFEWRNEGLSSRFLSGAKRQRDHIPSFDIHLDDLRSVWRNLVLPKLEAPLQLFAHSMGAHLALRWLAEDKPKEIASAVLTSPMVNLTTPIKEWVGTRLMRRAIKRGRGEDYALGQHDFNHKNCDFARNEGTHDRERFAVRVNYFHKYPDLIVGGVTNQWVAAALASLNETQKPGYLESIRVPVMMIAGDKDAVSPLAGLKAVQRRMAQAQLIVVPGAHHEIHNESDHYRAQIKPGMQSFMQQVPVPA